ncbi:MAG: DUF885 family protein, partial [Pseudomonadota bacterium]
QRAREALGERFDIREFHKVLLTNGSMPLTLLDVVVQRWIEDTLAAGDDEGRDGSSA